MEIVRRQRQAERQVAVGADDLRIDALEVARERATGGVAQRDPDLAAEIDRALIPGPLLALTKKPLSSLDCVITLGPRQSFARYCIKGLETLKLPLVGAVPRDRGNREYLIVERTQSI